MSLLTICQAVSQEAGFGTPTQVIGNSDDTTVMLLAVANRTGRDLRRRAWQQLTETYTFTTVASQEAYSLPSDYLRIIDGTLWDRHNYWQMRGSVSPQEWQLLKSGLAQVTARRRVRVVGNQFLVFPTPGESGEELVYEYVSKNWVVDSLSSPTVWSDYFTDDTQESLIDEDLILIGTLYRFLERKGFAYQLVKDEFDSRVDREFGTNVPREVIDLGISTNNPYPPLPLIPITGYSG